MSFENIISQIEEKSVKPMADGDYIDTDTGLLCCGRCGKRKERWLDFPAWLTRPGQERRRKVGIVCECYQREQAARKQQDQENRNREKVKRLRRTGIMDPLYMGYTFAKDRFPDSVVSKMARKYLFDWGDMRENNVGMIISGPVGTGKTFYAACIANALVDQGFYAFITSVARMTQAKGFGDDLDAMRDAFAAADLVVIDDLGAQRETEFAQERLFDLIDQRYRAEKPLIVTTNLTVEELKTKEVGRQRIYDRVLGMCPYRLKTEGQSLRVERE